jgi:hypothetical protein
MFDEPPLPPPPAGEDESTCRVAFSEFMTKYRILFHGSDFAFFLADKF